MALENIDMLILKLLEDKDMYGYQMIVELEKRSNNVFQLQTGTLYPLLHVLENKGYLETYEAKTSTGRTRKHYHITQKGTQYLQSKLENWKNYSEAVNHIVAGGDFTCENTKPLPNI